MAHPDIPPDEHDRIRMDCQALIRRHDGRLLLVNPDHEDGWVLPGGSARKDEPPHIAAAREVRNSVSLELVLSHVLVVDWTPRKDSVPGLNQIFEARIPEELASLATLSPKAMNEISEFSWVRPGDIPALCEPYEARRIQAALRRLDDPAAPVYHAEGYAIPT
jgi:ADP-ribose pyrophosphatase YjhB (NUDIX family)